MTEITAFLFDLDGTLVDSRKANYLAYRDGFAALGHDLTNTAFDTTWGRDSRDFIADLVPGISPEDIDRVRTVKAQAYAGHLPHSTMNRRLVEVAVAMRVHVKIGLVTTAKRKNVADVLAAHNVGDLFDVIVTGDDVSASKPDPEPYLLALALLGVDAESAVAFEDSDAGLMSAEAAGIAVIRVEEFRG